MKLLLIFIVSLMLFSGCQSGSNSVGYLPLKGSNITQKQGVNPNSPARVAKEKALDRHTQLEISKVNAQAKIEVAKIDSIKELNVAKIDSIKEVNITSITTASQTEIAVQNAGISLEMSKIEAGIQDKDRQMRFYIAILVAVIFLIALLFWYINKQKALQVQAEFERERLKQDLLIKERELQEQKILKVMDLAIHGKLPQNLQKDLIDSITQPKNNFILTSETDKKEE